MTRLEFFDKGYGLLGIKTGHINIKFLWRYDIYKTYQKLVQDGWSISEAKVRTMLTHKEKYLNVVRAIYWFEREEWVYKKTYTFRNVEKESPKALLK